MNMKELHESMQKITKTAYLAGKSDARSQVLNSIKTLLEKPEFPLMSNTDVIRWISETIALEFKADLPNENE